MGATMVLDTTRDSILDAAERLLPRFGYKKATLDDLAHEAGIGRRTIYLHFPSKEEVFLASIDRVVERLLVELAAIAEEGAPPDVRLWRMLVTRVMSRFDSVRAYQSSLDELLSDLRTQYLERRERYFDLEADVIAKVVDEGRRKLGWQVDDPHETARTLVVATNALLPYSLSRRERGSRNHVQTQTAALASLLLRGIQASAEAPASSMRSRRGR
jgi:AcrR family transcriptional regulator